MFAQNFHHILLLVVSVLSDLTNSGNGMMYFFPPLKKMKFLIEIVETKFVSPQSMSLLIMDQTKSNFCWLYVKHAGMRG